MRRGHRATDASRRRRGPPLVPVILAFLAGGLLTGALDAAGLQLGATPAEALLAAAAGVLFARVFCVGALVLALPVLLAGIELGTGGGGVTALPTGGDPLVLGLPGGHRLELLTVLWAAAYAAWAHAFGLRCGVTWAALAVVLLVTAARDGDLPALTLLAVALLGSNLGRLGGLLRE